MNNEEKILEMLSGLTVTIGKHGELLTELKTDVAELKTDVEGLKTNVAGLKETVEVLDARSLKSAVLLETDIPRSINRLYEGHGAIMEKLRTLASQDQVDEHDQDISIMKDAIKLLRLEVNELKNRDKGVAALQEIGITAGEQDMIDQMSALSNELVPLEDEAMKEVQAG